MDESWRMRVGMQGRKTRPEGPTTKNRHSFTSTLDPEDFSDVFGGPPRTLLSRKFSEDITNPTTSASSTHFYSEIFRTPSPEFGFPTRRSGRVLPAFRIPAATGEGFYGDVFASNDGRKSRERSRPLSKSKSKSKSKSESNSSSVLSSEELSPLPPVEGDDVSLSSFTSKLRPINVPCRWNSATMMPNDESKRQSIPIFQCKRPSYFDNHYMENDPNYNLKISYHGFSRHVSSPETMSVEPSSYRSVKFSVDDLELNCPTSPASPASSLCQEPDLKTGFMRSNRVQEQEVEHEEDEVMSSYVIEINSDHREESGEAASIDEAIAWAKEKFQSQNSLTQHEKDEPAADTESEKPNAKEFLDWQTKGHGTMDYPVEELKNWTTDGGKEQSKENLQMDMELLEEEIRLWSAGKETHIRLLLSTLHHVLWPNSGWYAVPLTSLIESSNVKKAYQKARLCLHPDKLQQRGAAIQHKYVADRVFSILQDAWTAFISADVFF